MTTEYICEHGIRSPHNFVHQLGPVTTGNGTLPTPVCNPVKTQIGEN